MKETTFVQQNKEKWKHFESLSKSKNNDPDEISELFTEITEDLSYARTFYPRRSVRIYLNQLAQGVFTSLYKQKKQPIRGFFTFWNQTVPLSLYRARKNLWMAFLFFTAAILLGAISQHFDSSFAEIVLGKSYLEATEDRIAAGNPMGIYGESEAVTMFLQITINNIQVAILAFVLGIFYSFGTYYILLSNGIMLGAFQWWFYAKGLLLTSFMAIWIHGAFEISAIVIAGAAGITLGNGLLFPKSFNRLQSLVFSAKQGFNILISLVPVFILAGGLESFITRYYQSIPPFLNWFIILGSFSIILMYYVIYPAKVAKKYPDKLTLSEPPRKLPKRKISLHSIRSSGQVFTDAIFTFIQKANSYTTFNLKLLTLPILSILIWTIYQDSIHLTFLNDWDENFAIYFGLMPHLSILKFISWSILITLVLNYSIYISLSQQPINLIIYLKQAWYSFFWQFILVSILMVTLIFFNWFFFTLTFIFFGFIFLLTPVIIQQESVNLFKAINSTFTLIKKSYGQVFGLSISIVIISIIFFFIFHNPFGYGIMYILDDFLEQLLLGNTSFTYPIINTVNVFVYAIFINYILQVVYINAYFLYYSLLEKKDAKNLMENIDTIGKRSKSFETSMEYD
ncbi:hypothetical protein DNU06_13345 [Putridiphycobacter roseus]|uniref:Stage II sporulation protein M n=1 Tax=Putridiphycobacter roseus TaxID=2219161 RepID=A0A2W1NB58_9FLAO|nr:stage II sporulation protein M [Putridiphycobacter roseus]PZE16293.1 hypothetical protein DNU06_13345 [Putridiphycobacter roseus]